ncbi:hypothetical protein AVEN_74187-1 [Araneus ventricosus]|uniref:Uncharacterized protein n=1 Tax=Araneus ventricosus TaxID=182803 RepID=A0A4Y2IBK8_ARAVE|nr:hypothetical protein AVEN_74187-1 [Araneus ventricosus]
MVEELLLLARRSIKSHSLRTPFLPMFRAFQLSQEGDKERDQMSSAGERLVQDISPTKRPKRSPYPSPPGPEWKGNYSIKRDLKYPRLDSRKEKYIESKKGVKLFSREKMLYSTLVHSFSPQST